MSRPSKGEGSIVQRGDGLWMAQIERGRDANGKRRRKTFYGATKKAVADKLTKEAAALLNGTTVDCGKMTLADLLQKWLKESAKPNIAPGTYAGYQGIIDNYLVPRIGHLK